jgi:hypothetical protein
MNAAPFNAGAVVLGSLVDSLVVENGSFGIYANSVGATSTLYVSNCTIRANNTGLRAQGAGSTIVFRNNVIADHGVGIQSVTGAALLTGLGNTMFNNATPGAPTGAVAPI